MMWGLPTSLNLSKVHNAHIVKSLRQLGLEISLLLNFEYTIVKLIQSYLGLLDLMLRKHQLSHFERHTAEPDDIVDLNSISHLLHIFQD